MTPRTGLAPQEDAGERAAPPIVQPRFGAAPGHEAGIFDTTKGSRLVAFFLHDKTNPDAAPAMARVCAKALNAAVATRAEQGGGDAT